MSPLVMENFAVFWGSAGAACSASLHPESSEWSMMRQRERRWRRGGRGAVIRRLCVCVCECYRCVLYCFAFMWATTWRNDGRLCVCARMGQRPIPRHALYLDIYFAFFDKMNEKLYCAGAHYWLGFYLFYFGFVRFLETSQQMVRVCVCVQARG